MRKNRKQKTIIRKFTIDPNRGAAALLAGSTAEGLPLKSFTRNGDKIVAVYQKP